MNGRGTRIGGAGIRYSVLAAVVLLLAGCTPAAGFPDGLSEAQVRERIASEASMWWESIAPGEPEPVVEPIAYASPDSRGEEVTACVLAAGLEGVRGSGGGIEITSDSPEIMGPFDRQQFVCQQLYPMDPSDPEAMGYFSQEQLEFLQSYTEHRLVPCLQMLGYTVPDFEGGGYWLPYFALEPRPASRAEWDRIDLACPPAPYTTQWRQGLY